MRPRNFALVVGAAVLAAFVLCMCLPSCGSPDCPCDLPSDGGADDGPDWFDVYYTECVYFCDEARRWGEECGHAPMAEGCVEWEWYNGTDPDRCDYGRKCYEALRAVDDCLELWDGSKTPGWHPALHSGGCPVQMP